MSSRRRKMWLQPRRAARRPAILAFCGWALAALPALAQGLPPSEAAEALATLSATAPGTPTAPAPTAQTAQPAPRPAPVAFTLRSVSFTGPSGYFSQAELLSVVEPYIGRQFTVASSTTLAEAINAAYQARGIDLAQAQVVGVSPVTGRVTIDLFEARLGAVRYVAERAAPRYLAMRTGLSRGDLADTRRIARRLERLALTDGVLADAAFAPGAAPGTTDLTVTLAEPAPTSTELRVDNYGEAGTGAVQAGVGFRINNLTGWNDPLSIEVTISQGARSVALGYARTVSAAGTIVGVNGSFATTRSITGPDRTSQTMSLGASVSHPLALSLTRELWASFSAEGFDETATTAAVPSADQSGIGATLALNGSHVFEDLPITSAAWSLSARAGRYDDAIRGATGLGFAAVAASVQVDAALGDWGRIVASGAGQFATADLPTRYDFAVTSPFAVPGYGIGLSQGATGYWARVQLEAAQPLAIGDGFALQPYGFAALGEAFDNPGGGWVGQGLAAGVGAGVTGQIGDNVSFDAQVARSLTTVLGQGPGWDFRAGLSVRF